MLYIRSMRVLVSAAFLFFWGCSVLLAVPLSGLDPEASRTKLLETAYTFKDTPYQYGGIAKTGMDCSGFVYTSFQQALGVTVPRTVRALYSWSDRIPISALESGDLLFFNTTGSVSHVGIYIGKGSFIHSASEGRYTGVIVSSLNESYWNRTFIGAGRALPAMDAQNAIELAQDDIPEQETSRLPDNNDIVISEKSVPFFQNNGFSFGAGTVMNWDPFVYDDFLRGASFQTGLVYECRLFGVYLSPGIEFRTDWDKTLGVFRFPLTLSLGLSDSFRIFAGPSLSLGAASIETSHGVREYQAESGFFATVGVSWVPVSFKIGNATLSVLTEAAWQSYARNEDLPPDWTADLSANLRLSTGLYYSMPF